MEDPQAFVDNTASQGIVEKGIADSIEGVVPGDVAATLTVGSRRLGRSLQEGTVDVAAVITVADAAEASSIGALAAAVTPADMATNIQAAAVEAGVPVNVTVTGYTATAVGGSTGTGDEDGACKPAVVPIFAGLVALFFSF